MSPERWTSRAGFIFAAMGSAIGLGSIWKFPYEVGANGGGGFVVFYLLGLGLIVFPLMLVELAIGRRGRSDAVGSIAAVAAASRASASWAAIGMVGVVGAVLILSFYSVIGGWAIAYLVDTIRDGLPGATAPAVQARYDALLASPLRMTVYHSLFMGATVAVVARGIAGGIERASLYLMPILIVLVVLLAIHSTTHGDAYAALRFLFSFDPAHLSARSALEALGLGFFSIGVGLAVMVTYAAYAGADFDLRTVAIVTILSDTAISFLAGLAVFPVVFAEGLDPSSGPGLMFVTLPLAFARVPLGASAAIAFFVLLSLAALASAMSLLEMPVALVHRGLGGPAAAPPWRPGPSAGRSGSPPSCRSTSGRAGARSPGCRVLRPSPCSERWTTSPRTCCSRWGASGWRSSVAGCCRRGCWPPSYVSAPLRPRRSCSCCATSHRPASSRPACSRSCSSGVEAPTVRSYPSESAANARTHRAMASTSSRGTASALPWSARSRRAASTVMRSCARVP